MKWHPLVQLDMLQTAWNLSESGGSVSEEEWLNVVEAQFDEIVELTFLAFEVGVRANEIVDHDHIALDWNFPAAIFFSTTVLTTIGSFVHIVSQKQPTGARSMRKRPGYPRLLHTILYSRTRISAQYEYQLFEHMPTSKLTTQNCVTSLRSGVCSNN
jgi:hypothetical protein